MKTTKRKVLTLITILMLTCVYYLPAVAAGPNTPEKGTLVIHKLALDDIAQAGQLPNNGEKITDPAGMPVNGVEFDIYLVHTSTSTANGYPAAGSGVTYTLSEGKLAVHSPGNEQPDKYEITKQPTVTTSETGSYGHGTAVIENLNQGLYFVMETNTSNAVGSNGKPVTISGTVAPFLVEVPMVNNNAKETSGSDKWLDTVHVYPKNNSLSISKSTSAAGAVEVGAVVPYTITTSIPGDIYKAKSATNGKYVVSDQLDTALDYTSGSVKVVAMPDAVDLTAGTDYKVDYVKWSETEASNQGLLVITLLDTGIDKLCENNAAKYTSLEITFDTTVNANILEKGVIKNDAELIFNNNVDHKVSTKDNGGTVSVHTAFIDVFKYAAKSKEALTGAKFKISDTETNAKAGKFIKIDNDSKLYYPDGKGYDREGLIDYEITLDQTKNQDKGNGNYNTFNGLIDSDGTGYNNYWLVETKAPQDYNLLNVPVKAEFTASTSTEDTNYTISIDVYNNKGFILPATGGVGMIIITIAGIVLLGLGVMVITSKKREMK